MKVDTMYLYLSIYEGRLWVENSRSDYSIRTAAFECNEGGQKEIRFLGRFESLLFPIADTHQARYERLFSAKSSRSQVTRLRQDLLLVDHASQFPNFSTWSRKAGILESPNM
jgi:hypothetical protein